MRSADRRGFILYIVISVLLGLAIMAFALNAFKTGAITQLSRNVDQNRLALLAQSANAEAVAIIKSQANFNPDSDIYKRMREIFPEKGDPEPALPFTRDLLSLEPQETIGLAKAGYVLKVETNAVLTVYRRAAPRSMSAYNGYIDVYSKAWREGAGKITMEAHERRDVRLFDLRHTLDKYALFVKNYSNDYNNTRHRLVIDGIEAGGSHDVSRIFIGTDNYPGCDDPRKDLWFDLYYEDHKNLSGFSDIFGGNNLKAFPIPPNPDGTANNYPVFNRLFYENNERFDQLGGVGVNMFIMNMQVINEYERVINLAADSCMLAKGAATDSYRIGGVREPPPGADPTLQKKCKIAIDTLDNENAYAQMMCQDYYDKSNGRNYANCEEFKKLLVTCQQNWIYRWGYTDAASLWDVTSPSRPPLGQTDPDRYAGISKISFGAGNYGPYMSEYRETSGSGQYNPERWRVGVMQSIYGANNDVPVLVEGKAYLRFFKLAYLDEFRTTVPFFNPAPVHIRVITNKYLRKDKTGSFLTTALSKELASSLFTDTFMKSRAIDDLSLNSLWGEKIKCYNGDGQEIEYDPMQYPAPIFEKPAQPTGSNVPATRFGRAVDHQNSSWNYLSSADFLAERAPGDGKLLYLDGFIYIMSGDLDLTGVTHFQGKGLIYLAQGNCQLGSIERLNPPPSNDSLRIYLKKGDFILDSSVDDIRIDASLAALYDDYPDPLGSSDPLKQGSLIFNNRSKVQIYGNLLVDSLDLESAGSSGLADGGVLHIVHDPAIYNAGATIDGFDLDPFHVSIGSVKTSFAYRAGDEEN